MASLLNGAGGKADEIEDPRLHVEFDKPVLEIYGPLDHMLSMNYDHLQILKQEILPPCLLKLQSHLMVAIFPR